MALATLPFLNKAFHIDDVWYLYIARNIIHDPFHPYDFTYVADGYEQNVFVNDWSPPFFKYLLAGSLLLFGEREVPLHGMMAIFTALLAGSLYALGRRFVAYPVYFTALVILNPLFVPGQNLMLDTPMLALGVGGIACHVWGTDRKNLPLIAAGGILAGLAIVTKYPAFITLPLLSIYSLQRRSWWGILAIALALVPFTLWSIHNLAFNGRIHFVSALSSEKDAAWQDILHTTMSALTVLGSGFFPFLFFRWLNVPIGRLLAYWLCCLCLALSWQFMRPYTTWWQSLTHIIFLAAGIFVILMAVDSAVGRRSLRSFSTKSDRIFLIAWFAIACASVLKAHFIAVRHLLWILPPAALLITEFVSGGSTRTTRVMTLGVVVTVGLSVAWADKELANLIRSKVTQLHHQLRQKPTRVYYLGEDGFAYYSARIGLPPLRIDRGIPARPFYVVAHSATSWAIPASLKPRLKNIGTVVTTGRIPVSTMAHGANYYRTGTLDLPYHIGVPTVVYFDVYSCDRDR